MQTVMRNVRDLDGADRTAVEKLVGHALRESERVVIHVTDATDGPAERPAPNDELPAWCNVYEGLSDAEIDELDRSIRRTHSSRKMP